MQTNSDFLNLNLDFWACVKLISQKTGYTDRKTKGVHTPSLDRVLQVFKESGLSTNRIFFENAVEEFGMKLLQYFEWRAYVLNDVISKKLMNLEEAKSLFHSLSEQTESTIPLVMNKQSGSKKAPNYLTCTVNILIEKELKGFSFSHTAKELTAFTNNKIPVRSLSRRVDGSFPSIINPIALWEIKEYYYTKTFGSRVADGVYETQLDGLELQEVRKALSRNIFHYLVVDDHFTWWVKGKSYLCRLIDLQHMGYLTEALYGREVVDRIPIICKEWIREYNKSERENY